ncbi:MAG: hypothetical protein M0P42_16185, partial [Gallionella sp.]|nr:hypothetical protein [Gallionella sp.]
LSYPTPQKVAAATYRCARLPSKQYAEALPGPISLTQVDGKRVAHTCPWSWKRWPPCAQERHIQTIFWSIIGS